MNNNNTNNKTRDERQHFKNILFLIGVGILAFITFLIVLLEPLLFALDVIKMDATTFTLSFMLQFVSGVSATVILYLVYLLQKKFTIKDWKKSQQKAVGSGLMDQLTVYKNIENMQDFRLNEKELKLKQIKKMEELKNKMGLSDDDELINEFIQEHESLKQDALEYRKLQQELDEGEFE